PGGAPRRARAPPPTWLYVHDDLTEAARAPGRAPPIRLPAALLAAVRRESHVVVLTLAEQIDGVLARGSHPPFATAVGIGGAGERVARALHARAGWFPSIVRVDVAREEDGRGGYVLASPAPLEEQLASLASGGPVALVDDTVFSGITMRAVLGAMPARMRAAA